jgi:hypothetical protein
MSDHQPALLRNDIWLADQVPSVRRSLLHVYLVQDGAPVKNVACLYKQYRTQLFLQYEHSYTRGLRLSFGPHSEKSLSSALDLYVLGLDSDFSV